MDPMLAVGRHGRHYTRDVDDVVDQVPDSTSALALGVDQDHIIDWPMPDLSPTGGSPAASFTGMVDGGGPGSNFSDDDVIDGGAPDSTFTD